MFYREEERPVKMADVPSPKMELAFVNVQEIGLELAACIRNQNVINCSVF